MGIHPAIACPALPTYRVDGVGAKVLGGVLRRRLRQHPKHGLALGQRLQHRLPAQRERPQQPTRVQAAEETSRAARPDERYNRIYDTMPIGYVQVGPSDRTAVGLVTLIWLFNRLLCSAWADGNLVEAAPPLGKMLYHRNQSQPNPTIQADGPSCS